MTQYKILSAEEILAANLVDWKHEDNKLSAQFKFANFREAIAFMNMVAIEAELFDHHPEWSNVYSKVDITLLTHHVGNKVTDRDVEMAKYISKAARIFRPS